MTTTGDYIKIHFIVFLWGFSAILGKLISIPLVEMIFYRALLATAGMALVLLFSRAVFRIGMADSLKLILTGLIIAMHWIAFYGAARIANVSVSLIGFATVSLFTAFLEPLSLGRKINLLEVALGCVVILGVTVIFSADFVHGVGFFVGILSALTAAVFSIINSKMIRRIHAYSIMFYEMAGATLGLLLFLPIYKISWAEEGMLNLYPARADWFYIGLLAMVCTVYAYTGMIALMKRVSVFLIQLTVNMEPVYGILMAVVIFGEKEKMSLNFYLGALMILSAVIFYPVFRRKFQKQVASNS